MDNETKNILKILGVAVVVLFLLKPKKAKSLLGKSSKDKDSVAPPKTESSNVAKVGSEQEFENATVSLKAFRSAVNNKESKSELDKLNRILLKDYGIKVFLDEKSGKLTARNSKGEDVAKEE
jgi:hypothetical protein